MTPLFMILTAIAFLLGGYVWDAHKGGAVLVGVAGLIFLLLTMSSLEVSVIKSRRRYYEQRVPNLEQLLDDYRVMELEEKIKEIKEGVTIETND